MGSVMSRRLRRLEAARQQGRPQYLFILPKPIQSEDEWLLKHAPQHEQWRQEERKRVGPTQEVIYPDTPNSFVWWIETVPIKDTGRLHELLEMGGKIYGLRGE